MGKPSLPWFKCFQDAWLKGTRDLSGEQRGYYFDCLCLMYEADGPIRDDDDWIAHRLHITTRKWRGVRKSLVEAGKLTETPAGLVNSRASSEIVERSSLRSTKSEIAAKRERKIRENPEFPFENNKTRAQLRLVERPSETTGGLPRARVIRSSEEEESKKEQATPILVDDDDPYRRRRELSPKIVATMRQKIGDELTDHVLRVYFTSEYARDARFIDKAFPSWLEKCYREKITDELTPKALAAEIMALCKGDTKLSTAAQLEARKKRLA